MSQCDAILDALKRGPVTPLDALREHACMRLAARIADLKQAGHAIRTEYVTERNRYGEAVRFARYHMEESC